MSSLIDSKHCYVPFEVQSFFDKRTEDLSEKEKLAMAANYFGRLVTLTSAKSPVRILSRERERKPVKPKVKIVTPDIVKFFIDFRLSLQELKQLVLEDKGFLDTSAKKNANQVIEAEYEGFDTKLFESINSFHVFVDFVRGCMADDRFKRDHNLFLESVHGLNRIYTVYNGVRTNVWARLQDRLNGSCLFPRVKFRTFLQDSDPTNQFVLYLEKKEDARYVRSSAGV